MTIVDPDEILAGMPPVQLAAMAERSAAPGEFEESTVLGTIGDAFMQENLIANAFTGLLRTAPPAQFGYNAFVDDPDIAFAEPEFADEYVNSRSPAETRQIAVEIAGEQARRNRLARAGGFGFVASMGAGILSPESLIPGVALGRAAGITVKGLSRARQLAKFGSTGFGRGAVNVGLAGALQESIAQLGLGAAQRTRTAEEQIFNVLGATVVSGILGGVGGAFGEARRGMRDLVTEEIREGLSGTRVQKVLDDDDFKGLPGEEQRVKLIEILSTENPQVARLLKDRTSILGRMWRKGFRWNPQGRLGTSRSQTHRIVVKRLTDNPMLRIDDVKLGNDVGTSVEAAIVLSYARTADSILRIRDVYTAAYRSGLRMKEDVFREEVTKAMRRGDKAAENITEQGARDAISQAAKIARETFDQLSDDAERVGLLDKRELKGTALSYVTRVWNRDRVAANQRELKRIFVAHFSNDHNLRKNPEELADQAIASIMGSRTGSTYIPAEIVGQAGPFRERLILVRDSDIEEFLENDIVQVMNRFVNSVAPQVELAKAFRTASASLDLLPARLDSAIARAERTGDTQELVDILEDTGSLRAAAALASDLTEDGLAKQRQIEQLMDRLPELRTQHRELVKRHSSQRVKVDQYEEALKTRARIQDEIGGDGFNELPKSVRKEFETEISEKELAPAQRRLDREKDKTGTAKAKVRDLTLELKKQRTRARRRQKGQAEKTPVDQDPEVQKVQRDLKAARTARDSQVKRQKEAEKSLKTKKSDLFTSQTTRNKFFSTWRRWIEDSDEALFPATRKALVRFAAAPKASRLRQAGGEYVAATGRVEALRMNISRTKRTASRLASEKDTAEAALKEADVQLKGLRTEAEKIDSGVPIDVKPSTENLEALQRAAVNAIGAARREDALRAVRMDAVIARGKADFVKLKDEPGANTAGLQAELEGEIKDIQVIRDRLLNRAGGIEDHPHHWAFRAERTFRQINFMRFMGGVTLSSIPDLAMSLVVNGLRPTVRAWRSVLRQPLKEIQNNLRLKPTEALSELSAKEELVRFAVALELASGARVKAFGDIGDLVPGGSKFERFVDRASDEFANLTLINRWNAYHKGIATLAVMNRMTDDIARLVGTKKLSRSGRQNLAASGINKEMAVRIKAQLDEFGTTDGGQVLPRTQVWLDAEAKKVFQEAVTADVRRTIITPSAGDLPYWMSRPIWRLAGQFRSFAMSATTKVLQSGLQRADAAVVQGAIFSVMMGSVAWALKEMVRGRDPFEQETGVWVQNAIDRSGLLGILMDVNGALERATHGRVGLSAVTSGTPATRFQARNVVDSFLGPSVGTATDLVQIFGSPFGEGGATQRDLQVFRKLVPFNQLFYARFLFDKLEGGAADFFNLPETARAARERLAQ